MVASAMISPVKLRATDGDVARGGGTMVRCHALSKILGELVANDAACDVVARARRQGDRMLAAQFCHNRKRSAPR